MQDINLNGAAIPMNAIQYSALETTIDYDSERDTLYQIGGGGDNPEALRQIYPPGNQSPYSHLLRMQKSQKPSMYQTPLQKSTTDAPYRKHVAERYEAEYDICMRWAADHKYRAGRIIPFQSNFYSVVRLSFIGRNWVLDCANYDGQYDYCGWLPSLRKGETIGARYAVQESVSDSSEIESRQLAGRTLRSSETIYGVKSIPTDKSNDDSLFTKDPVDQEIYKIMGESNSSKLPSLLNCQKFNKEMMTPVSPQTEVTTPREVFEKMEKVKSVTRSESFEELFYDLIELDQLFAKQAEVLETQGDVEYPQFPNFQTASSFSFSNVELSTMSQIEPDLMTMSMKSDTNTVVMAETGEAEIPSEKPPVKGLMSQLICITGKKFNFRVPIVLLIDWIKSKRN